MNSYHGSPIHLVAAELKRRAHATKSLSRLGEEALNLLKSQLDERIDDDNVVHIRLDLQDLLSGKVTLTIPGEKPTVKGRAKLEVYPGNEAKSVAISTIENAIKAILN